MISSVTNFGFFVRLNDFHIDGLVHVSSLQNDYYHFDPVRQALKGENLGRAYRLGDLLRVKVVGVNLDDKKIDFALAGEDFKPGSKMSKKGKKNRAATKAKKRSKSGWTPEPMEKRSSGKPRAGSKNKKPAKKKK